MKINKISQLRKSFYFIGTLAITLGCSVTASAQQYPGQNYPGQGAYQKSNAYVTVFEDCGFRGRSRSVEVGDYFDVRDLDIRNDSISSLQIPAGVEVTLYEHEELRGAAVTLDRDVDCLNKQWNEKASSFRVSYSRQGGYRSAQNREDRPQYQNSPRRQQNNQYRNANVDTAAVSRVSFATTALEKVAPRQWRIVNPNGSVENYREFNRDARAIYLQNSNAPGKVEIDLFANNVKFIAVSGQQVNYPITGTELGNVNNRASAATLPTSQQAVSQPSGLIRNRCFDYSAYTRGGSGGIRFHGKEGFFQFEKKAHSGRICHEGQLTMEVSKLDPATEVIVEIEGSKYVFASGNQGDTLLNNWYRKMTSLKVVPR